MRESSAPRPPQTPYCTSVQSILINLFVPVCFLSLQHSPADLRPRSETHRSRREERRTETVSVTCAMPVCSWLARRHSPASLTAPGACPYPRVNVWKRHISLGVIGRCLSHCCHLQCRRPEAAMCPNMCCTARRRNATWTLGALWRSSVTKATTCSENLWWCVSGETPGAPPSQLANVRDATYKQNTHLRMKWLHFYSPLQPSAAHLLPAGGTTAAGRTSVSDSLSASPVPGVTRSKAAAPSPAGRTRRGASSAPCVKVGEKVLTSLSFRTISDRKKFSFLP